MARKPTSGEAAAIIGLPIALVATGALYAVAKFFGPGPAYIHVVVMALAVGMACGTALFVGAGGGHLVYGTPRVPTRFAALRGLQLGTFVAVIGLFQMLFSTHVLVVQVIAYLIIGPMLCGFLGVLGHVPGHDANGQGT